MAKTSKKAVEKTEEPAVHIPAEVRPADVTNIAAKPYQEPELKRGEALVVSIDEQGNESDHFVTDINTAEKFYSGPKFSIKKKS